MDAFLDQDDVKPVFEKYFVPVKLVVMEHADHKDLENPGADAVLTKLGGPDGIPYFAFLDAQGALIVNSRFPAALGGDGGNIGYPGQSPEIGWFVKMMKQAAPKMSDSDLQTIKNALEHPKKVPSPS